MDPWEHGSKAYFTVPIGGTISGRYTPSDQFRGNGGSSSGRGDGSGEVRGKSGTSDQKCEKLVIMSAFRYPDSDS